MSETASLLAEHDAIGYDDCDGCTCGEDVRTHDQHRAHVAAIIDAHFAERERALVERVEALADWYDAQPNWKPWHIGASIRAALARPATEGEGA